MVGSHLCILILEDELASTVDERGSWMDPIVHFVRPELLDDSTTTSHLDSISSFSGEKIGRKEGILFGNCQVLYPLHVKRQILRRKE